MRRQFFLYCYLTFVLGDLVCDVSRIEQYIAHSRSQIRKRYRPHYHVSAPVGWLNDPAGFTFFKGRYHMFYQFHPFNSAWGPMHWGHVVSDNLIDWIYYPVALVPREHYESGGCFSGSVITHGNYLILFYTGNSHSGNITKQTQNVAVTTNGVVFQKYFNNPIIRHPPDDMWKFRHPKVWEHNSKWYMVVGSSTMDHRGRLVLYISDDLYSWSFKSTIAESQGDMGYMWENPDFFELDGQHVIMFSAHGIESDGTKFKNLYQTGYIVGKFNYETNLLEDMEISTATFNEIDHGHDFYAAQTMLAPDGRVLMVAWMGMWENEFMEMEDGWAGMMTLVRELRLSRDSKLLMTPIHETEQMRTEVMEDATYFPGEKFFTETKYFEMIVSAKFVGAEIVLVFSLGKKKTYKIVYSIERLLMSVDRGGVNGKRSAYWRPKIRSLRWRIFVDGSSIEIYCGAGEVVFSSRIYPRKKIAVTVGGDTPLHITQYKLRKTVDYDNVQGKKLWQRFL